MLKLLTIIALIYVQIVWAKKHKHPSSLEKTTSTISTVLKDIRDFFTDLMETVGDMMLGFGKAKKKTGAKWSLIKYAKNRLKSGYKMLKSMIPVLDMARSAMEDVGPILPNVTISRFIRSFLFQIVPDLIENQNTVKL